MLCFVVTIDVDGSTKQPRGELGVEQDESVKEETGQDEDILTFEEFKQRRMLEVQQHQQEEMKNTGEWVLRILVSILVKIMNLSIRDTYISMNTYLS